MKTPALLLPLACLALAACSKSSEPAAPSASNPEPSAASKEISIASVPAVAIAKAEAVVARVENKTAEAFASMETTVADAKLDAAKLYTDAVTKAKAFLGEKKFDQALASLDSLKAVVLTAEQQKLVADLRTQITQAQELYERAQGAAKNLFGK